MRKSLKNATSTHPGVMRKTAKEKNGVKILPGNLLTTKSKKKAK